MRFSAVCALLVASATAQVTETGIPNAEEYAAIKSEIAAYDAALTTEALYLEAKSYVDAHSTTVPPIGVVLHTASWAEDISKLNALVTTTFPPSFPTVVAKLYHSALDAQAEIINDNLAEPTTVTSTSTITKAALITGTGTGVPAGSRNTSTTVRSPTLPATTTLTSPTATPSTGAASAQLVLNGAMLLLGLGFTAFF